MRLERNCWYSSSFFSYPSRFASGRASWPTPYAAIDPAIHPPHKRKNVMSCPHARLAGGTRTTLDANASSAEIAENRKNTAAPANGCEPMSPSPQLVAASTQCLKADEY